jgi:hypothetical protein
LPTTPAKRQKERNRQDKQREKEERRRQKKDAPPRSPTAVGEDPDLAGIIPGPQPREDEEYVE